VAGSLWEPVQKSAERKNKLRMIPDEEEKQQKWIESRKVSEHLDQGFLPRNIIYDYDETYKDSNKVL